MQPPGVQGHKGFAGGASPPRLAHDALLAHEQGGKEYQWLLYAEDQTLFLMEHVCRGPINPQP